MEDVLLILPSCLHSGSLHCLRIRFSPTAVGGGVKIQGQPRITLPLGFFLFDSMLPAFNVE